MPYEKNQSEAPMWTMMKIVNDGQIFQKSYNAHGEIAGSEHGLIEKWCTQCMDIRMYKTKKTGFFGWFGSWDCINEDEFEIFVGSFLVHGSIVDCGYGRVLGFITQD